MDPKKFIVWGKCSNEFQIAPMKIESIDILLAVVELPAKQTCHSSPLITLVGKIG